MGRGGKHLTLEGREYIEKTYKTVRKEEIVAHLGIHISTLNRELRRCRPGKYSAIEAQRDYEIKLSEPRRVPRPYYGSKKMGNGLETADGKNIRAYIRVDPGVTVSTVIPVADEGKEPELAEHAARI